jgi:predicted acyl esterase
MTRGVVLMWLGVAAVAGVVATIAVPRTRAALMGALPPTWSIAVSAWRYGIRVDHDVVIAMPDGVRLGASLYRPRCIAGGHKANAPARLRGRGARPARNGQLGR